MCTRRDGWMGMNWIRQEKRLQIYLRDGLACVYCGRGVEEISLTLDHIEPHSQGGGNEATNLVTACQHCNKSRQDRSLQSWAKTAAKYAGVTPATVVRRVQKQAWISPDEYKAEAKKMIERRGSVAKALAKIG